MTLDTTTLKVGDPYAQVDIKLNKKVVGHISPPNWRTEGHEFKIRFAVANTFQPCGWKWISLKFAGDTEQAARDFITKNNDLLQEKFNLHRFDD